MKINYETLLPIAFAHHSRQLIELLNRLAKQVDPNITFSIQECDYENQVFIRMSKEQDDTPSRG